MTRVIIADLAQKILTVRFGKDGQCNKKEIGLEASSDGGYFISGPAVVLRLIDDKLTMAATNKLRIVTQFFQCGKS